MSLEEKINTDIKSAMLAKNQAELRGLRAIKAALLLAKTSTGISAQISADEEIKLLQKLVKQRKESLEIYRNQNREDLAVKELEEITVIEKYLPAQMSEDQIKAELKQIILSTGATTSSDMGKVMGVATKHFAGKADNKTIATFVKELLIKS